MPSFDQYLLIHWTTWFGWAELAHLLGNIVCSILNLMVSITYWGAVNAEERFNVGRLGEFFKTTYAIKVEIKAVSVTTRNQFIGFTFQIRGLVQQWHIRWAFLYTCRVVVVVRVQYGKVDVGVIRVIQTTSLFYDWLSMVYTVWIVSCCQPTWGSFWVACDRDSPTVRTTNYHIKQNEAMNKSKHKMSVQLLSAKGPASKRGSNGFGSFFWVFWFSSWTFIK
jgi:hypothetical protein